jgi:putative NADPH-quinone reductase
MSISVILAHPTPGSFNHAIADAAVATLRGACFPADVDCSSERP